MGSSPMTLVVLALLAAARPAGAHHAFAAEYDANKPIALDGTITKIDFVNPHAWLHLDVKGADGTVTSWDVECGPPNALIRRGWSPASVTVGMVVRVDGFRAKNGKPIVNGDTVTFPNGTRLFVGGSGNGAPYTRKDE